MQYLVLVNEAWATVLVPQPPWIQNNDKLELAVVNLYLSGLTLEHNTNVDSNLAENRGKPGESIRLVYYHFDISALFQGHIDLIT